MSRQPKRWIAWVEVEGFEDVAGRMKDVLEIMDRHVPVMEYTPPAGFYLDLSGLRLHPRGILEALVSDFCRAGFVPKAGLGPNKLLARAAASLVSAGGSFWLLEQGREDFLEGLPVESWPGLGRSRANQLRDLGIRRVRDFSLVSPFWVRMVFKKRGELLLEQSRGRDPRPVVRRLPRSLEKMTGPHRLFPPQTSAEKFEVLRPLLDGLRARYGRKAFTGSRLLGSNRRNRARSPLLP